VRRLCVRADDLSTHRTPFARLRGAAPPAAPLMTEISIPGHEVLNLIGEGGMAQVWAGARLGAGQSLKPVAIKVIHPEFSSDHRYQELFLSEGRTTMMFSHGNIVTVFDVGAIDEQLYMVMEWIDGVTLSEFARTILKKRGRPLEIAVALSITVQVLCALDYAHTYKLNRKKVGVIHCDICPQNVMITSSGEAKLLDFGVARISGGRTTRSLKGHPHYMPREQAQGNPRVESDLYAVGAMLFELLEGEKYRSHCTTEDEAIADVFADVVRELRRADVPEELRRLLRELLAVSWHDRPHSAAEVIKRLADLPVEQHSSILPIKELYWAFFGESHSGLTRFAHRDPQMWVDHMRKLGKSRGGRRNVSRPSGLDGAQAPESDAAPRSMMMPRAHEPVRLHRAGEQGAETPDAPPDARKKTMLLDADQASGSPEQGPAQPIERTVRLSRSDLPIETERRSDPIAREPTIVLDMADYVPLMSSAAVVRSNRELVTGLGSVVKTLTGSGAVGLARWLDLATGRIGLIVMAMVTFGMVLPLACWVTTRSSTEVRR